MKNAGHPDAYASLRGPIPAPRYAPARCGACRGTPLIWDGHHAAWLHLRDLTVCQAAHERRRPQVQPLPVRDWRELVAA